ncbi:AAA family ATPase [Paractinoplanes lichenicola]|uniref:Kinase n=1 Tax=Paractinoplanes lichenicola TaxID=2802976 RepID=A0ABS1VY48_9ACTN|nr:AAA family ATPase [Actinoplanes lichenicola]MBL7259418.1 kinase [Actinoplanes lichenicola]
MNAFSPLRPTLVVIRGNSGSGKTTSAREVRRRYGRGCALVEQDYVRRTMLREHDGGPDDAVAPGFVVGIARAALEAGYHVVLEGILHSRRYGEGLRRLVDDYDGRVFYLEVSFDETVRRHGTRAEPIPVTAAQMLQWYDPRDLLRVRGERVLPETMAFDEVVTTVLHDSGLAGAAATTPCPARCPRCAEKV